MYDSALLVDRGKGAVSAYEDASTGTAGSGGSAGARGPAAVGGGTTAPLPAAGMGDENDAGADADTCGDGKVSGGETCDTAIEAGRTGACPKSCPPVECAPRGLSGVACRVACLSVEGTLGCKGGDGCCPEACTPGNDSDCMARCGDGVVQAGNEEVCDGNCPTLADCDDGVACTTDTIEGTPEQCNVVCEHTPTSTLTDGDGCCPDGANASTDKDCASRCGNGIVEPGEACDGAGCDADCQMRITAEQMRCLAGSTNECDTCACMHCTKSELDCRFDTEPVRGARCTAILECTHENVCEPGAQACYCGPLLCIGDPTGPCKQVIDTASGGTQLSDASSQVTDLNTSIGRAYAADSCRIDQCKGVCR